MYFKLHTLKLVFEIIVLVPIYTISLHLCIQKHTLHFIRCNNFLLATLATVRNALASLLGFAQAIVLGRALGVDGYGLLAFVIAFVTIVNGVVDIRMWETVTKFVGEYHAQDDHGRARAVVKLAHFWNTCML